MGERQQIDFDIEIPGLEGLHLLEGVLDDALARAPERPAPREERALVAV